MITTSTLTTELVESLLAGALAAEDVELVDLCETALKTIIQPNLKREALARIAAILNARPLTADTITDDEVRELWRAGVIDSIERNAAIRTYRHGLGRTLRDAARARCAEILNARRSAS